MSLDDNKPAPFDIELINEEDWMKWFHSIKDQSPKGIALAMLNSLDGYGWDYGFEPEEDAQRLVEMMHWYSEYITRHLP